MFRTIALFAVLACAFAAQAFAACESHGTRPQALRLTGMRTEGGAQGSFQELVDLRTGYSRLSVHTGAMSGEAGFDGASWEYANGIVMRNDVPGAVDVARQRAVRNRSGWARGASTFTIAADDGPETTVFARWRCVAGLRYPFEQATTDATGERAALHIRTAKAVTVTPAMFAPPKPRPHGTILAGVPSDVPLRFSGKRDPHIIVSATVDGHSTQLIFDTGAANYFGPDAARALGLRVSGGIDVSGIGTGSSTGGFAPIDSISIGAAELRNEIAIVAPLPWPSGTGAPDGLTGLEFFAEFRTTIDYDKRVLHFESFDTPFSGNGVRVPFYGNGGHLYVAAQVNGKRGIFGVDTGDTTAITLFGTFARRIGIQPSKNGAKVAAGGMGGSATLVRAQIDTFGFAGTTLHAVPVVLSQTTAGAFASRTLAGNLGGRLFRCYRMTIDYRARLIIFDRHPGTEACLKQLVAP